MALDGPELLALGVEGIQPGTGKSHHHLKTPKARTGTRRPKARMIDHFKKNSVFSGVAKLLAPTLKLSNFKTKRLNCLLQQGVCVSTTLNHHKFRVLHLSNIRTGTPA